jgi:hypothetical protein
LWRYWLEAISGAVDRLTDNTRGHNTRLQDLFPILSVVPAIDAAAGEVDHDVRAVDFVSPDIQIAAIPLHETPLANLRSSAQDDYLVALGVKCTRQNGPDLS